jgi:hypothetical protein
MKTIRSLSVKQHRSIGDHVIAYLDNKLGRDWDKPDWDTRRVDRALDDLELPECEHVFYHNPVLVEYVNMDNGKRYLKITVTLIGMNRVPGQSTLEICN